MCNSEDETTDEESDDLEDIEANENIQRTHHKYNGPRKQFRKTLKYVR